MHHWARDGLEVLVHPFATPFAAEATFAVATKPGGGIELVGAVNPNHACFDLFGDIESHVDIL